MIDWIVLLKTNLSPNKTLPLKPNLPIHQTTLVSLVALYFRTGMCLKELSCLN